jgi:hypothetical protein
MDDTAQNQVNNGQTQAQPAVRTPLDNVPQPEPPVIPVGSTNKEVELAPVSDYVVATEKPIVKDKEVAESGVTEVPQGVELGKEHEQIGVKNAAETTPVKTEPSNKVQLPLEQAEAQKIVKTNKNTRSSIVWLAILMLKHFKKLHRKLLGKII